MKHATDTRRMRLLHAAHCQRQSPWIANACARRMCVLGLSIASVLMLASPVIAGNPADSSTSMAARQDAIRSIPFDEISRDLVREIESVVSKPSIYRRLPVSMIDCDPDLFVFMVRYPEVVVNMWQLMDITKLKLTRTGNYQFDADDGAGTFANVQLVYGTPDLHIYYGTGFYEGPLLKRRTKGRCVLVLSSGSVELDNGRNYVTSRLDVFVRVDSVGAELVAKTLQPLVGKTADFNFTETTRFISEISRAAETRWSGMERLLPRLKNVKTSVRDKFALVAGEVKHNRSRNTATFDVATTQRESLTRRQPAQPLPPMADDDGSIRLRISDD